jgi:hypothetical protein
MSITLNHKVLPPGLPRAKIARDRLDEQFARLLDSHETIGIFAAAGSGKTVQAQLSYPGREAVTRLFLDAQGGPSNGPRPINPESGARQAHPREQEQP